MPRYLSHLLDQSGDFLIDTVIWREKPNELIVLQTDYAVHAYARSLFEAYEIDFPLTLINAVPKRQSEFLAGRILARAALDGLHHAKASIAIGSQGAPVWPSGVSGSISHSHGRCICLVVADENKLIGIDVEKIATGAAFEAILEQALNPLERERVFQQTAFDASILATLIFSAKETIFKALHPVVLQFFGFEAAVFNGIYDDNILSLSIVEPLHDDIPLGKEILVHFQVDGEFVTTWTMLER